MLWWSQWIVRIADIYHFLCWFQPNRNEWNKIIINGCEFLLNWCALCALFQPCISCQIHSLILFKHNFRSKSICGIVARSDHWQLNNVAIIHKYCFQKFVNNFNFGAATNEKSFLFFRSLVSFLLFRFFFFMKLKLIFRNGTLYAFNALIIIRRILFWVPSRKLNR